MNLKLVKYGFVVWVASVLSVTMLMLSSCGGEPQPNNRKVATSIEPLRYFASQIAGDEWQIFSVVPEGYSPEDYSPSAHQMIELAQSRALLKVGGLGFENTWLDNAMRDMPQLRVFDTFEGVEEEAFDPHTWTSPKSAKAICRNICKALCEMDSANSECYSKRLDLLLQSIDSLHNEIKEILADLPSRSFVIVHPALTRFAKEYDLNQLAIEKDGKEPSPQSIKELVTQARKDGVRVVFVQKEFSDMTARVIAEQTGAKVVEINPLSYDWRGEILHIARMLKETPFK